MSVNTLGNIAVQSLGDFIVLIFCNWVLFYALQKIKNCCYINRWFIIFLDAAYPPVLTLLWVVGFFSIYYQLSHNDSFELIIHNIHEYQSVCLIIPCCWFFFRLNSIIKNTLIDDYKKNAINFDPLLITMLTNVTTIVIAFFSIAIIFHFMNLPMDSLIIYRGALSIALGLAAQNILGNFFGGIMILTHKQFKVGDWISSPDKNIEGIVEEIKWNSTKIRTLDRRPFYVPNAIFTHIIIINSSNMYNRHIKQIIGLRYQDVDKINNITTDITMMLSTHPEIDHLQQATADWMEFGSHALHIEIDAFTKTTDRKLFRKAQQNIYVEITKIIYQHKAQIAIPITFIHSTIEKK